MCDIKTALKWVSLIFALVVVGFSIYGLLSTNGMTDLGIFCSDFVSLLVVFMLFVSVGSVLICVGAFTKKRTLVIIGLIVFCFGIAALIIGIIVNANYLRGKI